MYKKFSMGHIFFTILKPLLQILFQGQYESLHLESDTRDLSTGTHCLSVTSENSLKRINATK